jgi:hypothetical protein
MPSCMRPHRSEVTHAMLRPAAQVKYLLSGIFGRACRALGSADKVPGIQQEAKQLRQLLAEKLVQVGRGQGWCRAGLAGA